MKPASFFILTMTLMTLLPCSTLATAPLEEIRRIVFLSDSITQDRNYTTDVEAWLISQCQRVEVLNIGPSSETATKLTAAYQAQGVDAISTDLTAEMLATLKSSPNP